MRHPFWKYLLATAILFAAVLSRPLTTRKSTPDYPPQSLRCVIDLKGEPVRGLTVGMNKIILREFADDHNLELEFIMPADSADYLDSLLEGTVDLLVMYRADSLHADGFISTIPYRDSTVWVLREDHGREVRLLNNWIGEMNGNGGIGKIGKKYLRRVGSSLTSISPYDDIVKRNADEMGWDWRLLSAIIYHESKFINESCSDKGAVGLMLRWSASSSPWPPTTAAKGTCSNASGRRKRRAWTPPAGTKSSPSSRTCPASTASRRSPTCAKCSTRTTNMRRSIPDRIYSARTETAGSTRAMKSVGISRSSMMAAKATASAVRIQGRSTWTGT